MVDLSSRAGLPIYLDGEKLVFGDGVVVRESKTRTRAELEPVARDPRACVPRDDVQYWMWNDVARAQDMTRLKENAVQYELTLLSARALGDEKSKTLGHVHNTVQTPRVSQTLGVYNPTFAEIFEVLHGTAHFVFFTLDESEARATFFGMTEANAGTQLVCSPNLYHLTINARTEPLLFADLISRRAHGIYDTVKAMRGAPYYELESESSAARQRGWSQADRTIRGDWIRNQNWKATVPFAQYSPFHLKFGRPLYTQFVLDPASFDWLDDPLAFYQKFPRAWV